MPLRLHKDFRGRHFYQRMIKASLHDCQFMFKCWLFLADKIRPKITYYTYLFTTWIIWQFVVGCHVENLHPSIHRGQNNLKCYGKNLVKNSQNHIYYLFQHLMNYIMNSILDVCSNFYQLLIHAERRFIVM